MKSRLALFSLAALVGMASAQQAFAGRAAISWGETIRPTETPWDRVNIGSNRSGSSNYAYTGDSNVHGYANASSGKLGAFAAAQRINYGAGGVYPGGYPYVSYGTENQSSSFSGQYSDQVVVQGAHAGDAVTIAVKLRLDGKLVNGPLKQDPLNTTSNANMYASFRIVDRTITDGEQTIPLVSFDATASAQRYTSRTGSNVDYYLDHDSSWNVFVRTDDNHVFQDGDQKNVHNEADASYWSIGGGIYPPGYIEYGDVLNFDTGELVLTFQTYVGAVLDISSDLSVDATSGDNTGLTLADFSNTLGSSWQIVGGNPGDASLKFTSSDWGTEVVATPEPASLAMLTIAGGALMMRRRK